MATTAGIIVGTFLLICSVVAMAFICWKCTFCRTRSFWDNNIKKLIRKIHAICHKEKKEDKMQLVTAPAICRSSKVQAPFVVPQIFVDYGSRRTSCTSEADRRVSLSSNSSRRTSFASESDRRGSGSSFCSRRTSLASDTERRGSASSYYSRRTSLASDTDRRGSASSRSSKRDSDIRSDDIEQMFYDYSDSDVNGMDDGYKSYRFEMLEEEKEEEVMSSGGGGTGKRSMSLAEIGKDKGSTSLDGTPCKKKALKRRGTLSTLVVNSLSSFEHNLNPPPGQQQFMRKKQKTARQNVIGLPDSPYLMHDLNLEEMAPRYAPPVKPTGQLKLQLNFIEDKTSLNIFIIEAQNLVMPACSQQPILNPSVKGFLTPGRTVKFHTKTVYKTKNPVFLEKFTIKELSSVDFTDDAALEFQMYSAEPRGRRHLLGVGTILLKDIDQLTDGKANLTLMPQTVLRLHQGDLRISGCYQPVAGKMVFNVIEAKQIPKVTLVGTVNPYIKVEMYVNGIREAKHKTKVRQNMTEPAWHHQCIFDINRENPKLLGHVFVFTVMHKDMMTGAHRIGKVELGWYSHGEQLRHWYEIMEHPHRPADYWHPVIKESKLNS
ncbi:synaptotagmin-7-like [Argonauta hians]